MKVTFNKADLEKKEVRNTIVKIISDAKHGGFMRIQGFQTKTGYGEIQNTTYQKGINYQTAINKSLAILETIENNNNYQVTVTRGVWTNKDGEINPTGRKSKVFNTPKTVTETYTKNDKEMIEALQKVRKSLTNPYKPTKEYEKLGNGVYQDENNTLYIRDLRLISKEIVVHGNYPFKAKKAVTAIVDAIKRDMPISKYRMFRLDATFDKISLGGFEIMPEIEETSTKQIKEKGKIKEKALI